MITIHESGTGGEKLDNVGATHSRYLVNDVLRCTIIKALHDGKITVLSDKKGAVPMDLTTNNLFVAIDEYGAPLNP